MPSRRAGRGVGARARRRRSGAPTGRAREGRRVALDVGAMDGKKANPLGARRGPVRDRARGGVPRRGGSARRGRGRLARARRGRRRARRDVRRRRASIWAISLSRRRRDLRAGPIRVGADGTSQQIVEARRLVATRLRPQSAGGASVRRRVFAARLRRRAQARRTRVAPRGEERGGAFGRPRRLLAAHEEAAEDWKKRATLVRREFDELDRSLCRGDGFARRVRIRLTRR
jgi:hypothetical protein